MTRRLAVLGRKLRRAPEAGLSLRDVALAARMTGWAIGIRVLMRRIALPRLVRFAWPRRRGREREPDRERRVTVLARQAADLAGARDRNCLARSLLAYRFLAKAGADPHLVVGFRRCAQGLDGHAWVVVDDQPVGEAAETVGGFRAVLAFGTSGEVRVLEDGLLETGVTGEALLREWRD